jgi:hypothetical protein
VIKLMTVLCAWLCAMAFVAAPAAAASAHTWVSTGGADTGDCGSPSSPCASLQGAYSNTATNGEINCLNSGSYGPLTVYQPITVNCEGTVSTASVINILNTGGGVIVLRGLDLDAEGSNFNSTCAFVADEGAVPSAVIAYFGNGALHLQKMKINHATGAGCAVQFIPSAGSILDITDSDITDIGTTGTAAGVYVAAPPDVEVNVTIENSRIIGNYFGVFADGRPGGVIKGAIKDCVVSDSTENGITALSSGSSVVFLVDQTEVSANAAAGLFASGSGAGILARNSSVFINAIGLDSANGAGLISYGNNSVAGNATNGAFTATVSQQ